MKPDRRIEWTIVIYPGVHNAAGEEKFYRLHSVERVLELAEMCPDPVDVLLFGPKSAVKGVVKSMIESKEFKPAEPKGEAS